ncbi:MAG: ribosomal-processing cysteine protease Prp [Ruminococcaceae bacterium]|nr:ribosomal-processing cysteine protease Prp [Oscillospiraceae bacterium]
MTKIDFYRDANRNIVKFTMSGHADFSRENDVVCAALSATVNMVLNGLEEVVGVDFGYEVNDGEVFFVLPDDISSSIRNDVNILLDSFCMYLHILETDYQDNISISELEV